MHKTTPLTNRKSEQGFRQMLKFAALWFGSFSAHQVLFKNANILLTGLFAKISVTKSWLLGSELGPGLSARDITFCGFKSGPVNWLIDWSSWKARKGDCNRCITWRIRLADFWPIKGWLVAGPAVYITWRIRLASKACPASRVTGVDTWPAFTQIMFGNWKFWFQKNISVL